jgi:hypothetical protein
MSSSLQEETLLTLPFQTHTNRKEKINDVMIDRRTQSVFK